MLYLIKDNEHYWIINNKNLLQHDEVYIGIVPDYTINLINRLFSLSKNSNILKYTRYIASNPNNIIIKENI